MKRPTLSVCLIMKDEERNLPNFLENASRIADEIVVVDTGSSDNSINLIQEFKKNSPIKISLYEYKYSENFHYVKAKNFSIEKATKDYIFILDADEQLSEEFIANLSNFLESQKPYVATIRRVDELVPHLVDYPVRIIKNHEGLFYKIDETRRVHEEMVHNFRQDHFNPVLWHSQRENHWLQSPQRMWFQIKLAIDPIEKDSYFLRHVLRGIRGGIFKFNKIYFKRKVYKDGYIGFKYSFLRGLEIFLINFYIGLKPKGGKKYWEGQDFIENKKKFLEEDKRYNLKNR